MDVKSKLQTLMDQRGWTYYRLAKESGVSWSTIRNMFLRGTEPTLPTLEALCGGLGISLAELLLGDGIVELSGRERELLLAWRRLGSSDQKLFMDLLLAFSRRNKL